MCIHLFIVKNLQINMNQMELEFLNKKNSSSAVSMTGSVHFHCTWICDDCAAKMITLWLKNVANDVYYRIILVVKNVTLRFSVLVAIAWHWFEWNVTERGMRIIHLVLMCLCCFVHVWHCFHFLIGLQRQCFAIYVITASLLQCMRPSILEHMFISALPSQHSRCHENNMFTHQTNYLHFQRNKALTIHQKSFDGKSQHFPFSWKLCSALIDNNWLK